MQIYQVRTVFAQYLMVAVGGGVASDPVSLGGISKIPIDVQCLQQRRLRNVWNGWLTDYLCNLHLPESQKGANDVGDSMGMIADRIQLKMPPTASLLFGFLPI